MLCLRITNNLYIVGAQERYSRSVEKKQRGNCRGLCGVLVVLGDLLPLQVPAPSGEHQCEHVKCRCALLHSTCLQAPLRVPKQWHVAVASDTQSSLCFVVKVPHQPNRFPTAAAALQSPPCAVAQACYNVCPQLNGFTQNYCKLSHCGLEYKHPIHNLAKRSEAPTIFL